MTAVPNLKPIVRTGEYVLTRTLSYRDPDTGLSIRVPAGFKTDGASVPRFLWRAVGHPFQADVIRAAVIHDYLYQNHGTKTYKMDRYTADRIFLDILKEDAKKRELSWIGRKIAAPKPWTMYRGVRLGGGSVWRKSGRRLHAFAS